MWNIFDPAVHARRRAQLVAQRVGHRRLQAVRGCPEVVAAYLFALAELGRRQQVALSSVSTVEHLLRGSFQREFASQLDRADDEIRRLDALQAKDGGAHVCRLLVAETLRLNAQEHEDATDRGSPGCVSRSC